MGLSREEPEPYPGFTIALADIEQRLKDFKETAFPEYANPRSAKFIEDPEKRKLVIERRWEIETADAEELMFPPVELLGAGSAVDELYGEPGVTLFQRYRELHGETPVSGDGDH